MPPPRYNSSLCHTLALVRAHRIRGRKRSTSQIHSTLKCNFIYLSLCIDTHVDACRGQKRALDSLEVEATGDYKLPCVGAGTLNLGRLKDTRIINLLTGQLSSPPKPTFSTAMLDFLPALVVGTGMQLGPVPILHCSFCALETNFPQRSWHLFCWCRKALPTFKHFR